MGWTSAKTSPWMKSCQTQTKAFKTLWKVRPPAKLERQKRRLSTTHTRALTHWTRLSTVTATRARMLSLSFTISYRKKRTRRNESKLMLRALMGPLSVTIKLSTFSYEQNQLGVKYKETHTNCTQRVRMLLTSWLQVLNTYTHHKLLSHVILLLVILMLVTLI
jgi:hypothetical protein